MTVAAASTAEYQQPTKVSAKAVVIWGLGALFYFYEFMLQASPSVMVPDLMRAFNVNAEQIGNLSAYYFYAYALMQIPVGLLMDKFGPRSLITMASLSCAAGTLFFTNSEHLFYAQLGRALMGFGGAFAVVGCLKLTSLWMPQKRFALFAGLMVAVGMLGAAFGQAPLAILIEAIGWRQALYFGAISGFVIAALIWLVMRDTPQGMPIKALKTLQSSEKHYGMLPGLWRVMRDSQTWVASVYAALMFVPTIAFGELWGVPYLMERFEEISRPTAAFTISIIFVGWAVGGPFFGWLSDKMQRRNFPMYIGTIGNIAAMYLILDLPHSSLYVIGFFLFLLGFFSSAFVLAFSVVRENHPLMLGGTAVGFINMLNTFGGAVGQPLIGKLLDNQWTGEMLDGAKVFTLEAYRDSLNTLPWCLMVSFVVLFFIKETRCKLINKNNN